MITEVEERRDQHAAEDDRSERVARRAAGARREHERKDRDDERDRRHQNRAKPGLRGAQRRLHDGRARAQLLVGELDDQNRALAGQADEHDVADLRVGVLRERRVEEKRDRQVRKFMKSSAPSSAAGTARSTISGSTKLSYCAESTRKTKTSAEREDDRRRATGRDLIELQARPFVAARPAASTCVAICCIAWIASPVPWPGAALPLSSMLRYRL